LRVRHVLDAAQDVPELIRLLERLLQAEGDGD
jgi:hypothetical protein